MSELHNPVSERRFYELYCIGQASADELDAFVGTWHATYGNSSEFPPLHEFLGLTRDEYSLLIADPFSLPCIRQARQTGTDIAEIIGTRLAQLKATDRPADRTIIVALGNWLERQRYAHALR